MAKKSIVHPAAPGSVAPLNKAVWDDPAVRDSTNCYAFAANDPHGHPGNYGPQPGDRDCHYLREISVREVAEKAALDGFIPIHGTVKPKPGYTVVALAVAPNEDYHWYRQMDDGTWWHKPAPGKEVTNLDYSGEVITDPRTANRRNRRFEYTQFGGFFYVPNAGLKVGITKDRAPLREYEIVEVIDTMSRLMDERKKAIEAGTIADNAESKTRLAAIKKMRPRHKVHALWRRFLNGLEDGYARLRGHKLPKRIDPDGAKEALSTEMAGRARERDRKLCANEHKKLRGLIAVQEERARRGWRPSEDLLRYVKARPYRGQQHSFVVAADVRSGQLNKTILPVNLRAAANSNKRYTRPDIDPVAAASPVAERPKRSPDPTRRLG